MILFRDIYTLVLHLWFPTRILTILSELLYRDYKSIVAIDFSDNLNLLTIDRNIQEIYYYLEVV